MPAKTQPGAAALTDAERATLAAVADCIIPASAAHAAPSAGDPSIAAAIETDAVRRIGTLKAALAALDRAAEDAGGEQRFADLSGAARDAVAATFRARDPAAASFLESLTAQCYYRDDRVMRSLGMDPRPPHPAGYTVAQGDWSLLDPIRRRPAFFRPDGRS
jgi:hypothetical protein